VGFLSSLEEKSQCFESEEGSIEIIFFEISGATFIDLRCIFSLVSEAEELQLFKRSHGKLPARGRKLFVTPV